MVNEVLVKNDMGFVLGVLEIKGTIMGRSVPGKIRFSSVFIKEDDQWRLQLRTMTPMGMKKS
ncbi:MAG: ketosteroid isomerase-like protein [Flavobacteriales bacterium]